MTINDKVATYNRDGYATTCMLIPLNAVDNYTITRTNYDGAISRFFIEE